MLKKKLLIGVLALAFVLVVGVSTADAYSTLRLGSKGADVVTLQTKLGGLTADGSFGNLTLAAVKAFQTNKGLTADGVVGPMTWAALMSTTPTTGTLPAGCTSTVGYSSLTGAKCDGSTTTGGTDNGPLVGGAGEMTLTSTSTGVKDEVKENDAEKVLGFKVEAEDSDLAVTSVKLVLANVDGGSEKLTDYLEKVNVYMGSTKVGSVDASDFSRSAGSPDVFSKSVALTNAIVRDGNKNTFYVEVETGSVDSDDILNAEWAVTLDSLRYQDATGVIMSETDLDENDYSAYDSTDSEYDNTFTFADASDDDDLSIKSSTTNPDAATLVVEEDSSSDEYLVGAFKFDVDEDSSDITINEFTIEVLIDEAGNTATDTEAIIDSVMVKVGSNEYDADIDDATLVAGQGTATYIVSFDSDEMVVDAGDDVEVKVYATFNDQDGNYATGTTVKFSVDGASVDAEGEEDLDADNSFAGKVHTLELNTVPVATLKTPSPSLALSQAIEGVGAGAEDVFLAKITFMVEAGDEAVYVSADGDDFTFNQLGAGNVDSVVIDSSDIDEDDGAYLVEDSGMFTLSFYVRANSESERITLTGIPYGFDAAINAADELLTSGLTTFKTPTVYLAK